MEFAESRVQRQQAVRLVPLVIYFTTIVVAESLATFGEALGLGVTLGLILAMALHIILVFSLLGNASMLSETDKPLSGLLMAFALVPLIRILSLALPLIPFFTQIQWFAIITLPLVVGAIIVMYLLRLRPADVYLGIGEPRNSLIQVGVAMSGLALGVIEFYILTPTGAWIPAFLPSFLIPASIVMVLASGFAEEFIFRGILLTRTTKVLGGTAGLVFVSLLFAAMHIGFVRDTLTALDILFVFVVGIYFGYVAMRTKSLLGVVLAHGFANVALYLVLPFSL